MDTDTYLDANEIGRVSLFMIPSNFVCVMPQRVYAG